MDNQPRQLETLVEKAKVILITSHISPDPDAVCSVLLLGETLQLNFPDKKIEMVMEEEPDSDPSFLGGYNNIKFTNLFSATQELQPDLLILVDAMNYERISRTQGAELSEEIAHQLKSKLVIIDHHTDIGLEKADLYINNKQPATVQEIYNLLFKELSLKKPEGFAQTTLLGIITDTGRFLYDNPSHRQTFAVVSELLDSGASIEALENRLERYTKAELDVLSNLAKNVTDSGKGYTYSFVDDNTADRMLRVDPDSLKAACGLFTDQFIRNFENNLWGFVIYPELTNGKKTYSVSLRSVGDHKNVAEIAGQLGGGGHEPAAGAKGIMASDVKSAVKFVQSVIEDNSGS